MDVIGAHDARHQGTIDLFRQFMLIDIPLSAAWTVSLFALFAFFPSPALSVMGSLVALNTFLLVWARRRADRGDLNGAVLMVASGLFAITLAAAAVFPIVFPVVALVGLLPVFLCLTFLDRRSLTVVMLISTGVSIASSLLSLADDPFGVFTYVPGQVVSNVIVAAVPVVTAVIYVLLWIYSTRLQRTLAETQIANLALRESERSLESKVAERTRELADARDQALEATRAKSVFLSNMSHELRTPLNAIIGFSEVLLQRLFGELNPKQAEYLQDVLDSGKHQLALVNDILDLSKVEAGRMELQLSWFSLQAAVQSGVTMLGERAARRGIALEVVGDPSVGTVEADERKVRQVLFNLLSNAVNFTPEGGTITVRTRVAADVVEISVEDTGVGIPTEDLDRIFEEFGQATSGKEVEASTGLGLTLAKRFVELHGGAIRVDSTVGVGSTFTFSLPLRHDAIGALAVGPA